MMIIGNGYSIKEIKLNSNVGRLARIGFAEFRGSNNIEQKVGMDITINRVKSSRYPNTFNEVINQPWQYSSLNDNDPNKKFYESPIQQIKSSESIEQAWIRSVSNSLSIISGANRGISKGATLYYSPRSMVPKDSEPNWNFRVIKEIHVEGIRKSHLKLFKE
jgi:membrane protease subunit (stomatin/prohibitin family)